MVNKSRYGEGKPPDNDVIGDVSRQRNQGQELGQIVRPTFWGDASIVGVEHYDGCAHVICSKSSELLHRVNRAV